MWKKIGAFFLLLVAGFGLLLCLAGVIGVWVFNTPVTDTVTSTLSAANGYVELAGTTTGLASDQVQTIRQQMDSLQSQVVDASAREKIQREIVPVVVRLRNTFVTLRTAAVTLNRSLESANRIPGVDLPTFTDELQAADQVLDQVNSELTATAAELSNGSVDGSKVAAAYASTSDKLASLQAMLDRWTGQVTRVGQALVAAEAAAPRLIDWTSLVLSVLFLLFGAGQVCLIARAIRLFRM